MRLSSGVPFLPQDIYFLSGGKSFFYFSCEEIPPESLSASDTTSSQKSNMSASPPFIFKETLEGTSNCESLLKIYRFPSFLKSLSSTKPTPTLSAIYALTTSDRV